MFTSIRLQQFRSYKDETFELDAGVNIIVGPNASGKTSLLEAIMVAAVGSSYRGRDSELIRHETSWSRIDALSGDALRTIKIQDEAGTLSKTHEIADRVFKRLDLQRTIPLVVFEPEHLQLLNGSPERRRDFMDNLLEQTEPAFGHTRRHYKRALAQRNALIKQGHSMSKQNLFVWNLRLSELGGQLATSRMRLIDQINVDLQKVYRKISGDKATVTAKYVSKCSADSYASSLLQKLESHLPEDLARGFTVYGPHRDDMRVLLRGHPAESTASRGEVRTLVLALKIIEAKIIQKYRDVKPMLLLDDVFSELDGSRRRALTAYLKDHQTFITTTDADVVVQHFMAACHIIPMG